LQVIARIAIVGAVVFGGQAIAQETLYGVTATDLVRIDLVNPADVEVVGPHGLVPTERGGQTFGAFSMTYDRGTDRLLGLYYFRDEATGHFEQYLVEYDRATGAGTLRDLLASSESDGFVEAIEYVDPLDAVLVSRDPGGTITTSLESVNPDGTTTPVTDNGRDNDYAVYDPTRDRFYVIDPNNVGRLSRVDLATGETTDLGPIYSSTGDMAYSARADQIFAYVVDTGQLMTLGNGLGSRLPIPLGFVGGVGTIQGLAIVDNGQAPACPADLDGDGVLTGNDLAVFWGFFRRGDMRADINADGFLRRSDIFSFVHAYLAGC